MKAWAWNSVILFELAIFFKLSLLCSALYVYLRVVTVTIIRIPDQFKGRVALPRPTFEVSTGKKADIGLGGGLQVNLDEVNVLVDI